MNKHTNELPVSRFCLNLWLGNVTPLECEYFYELFYGRETNRFCGNGPTNYPISALGIEE